jgi:DNA modification methylase
MALFTQEKQQIPSNLLRDKYGWPPFSILNTISWDWQRRRDEWEILFKDSTAGRDVKRYNATPTNTFSPRGTDVKKAKSISEFDPYLCELMYRWFSREGDTIVDPFAGGCVRGVVASVLGRNYNGVDLSTEQVQTNTVQFNDIQKKYTNIKGDSTWYIGDSAECLHTLPKADMIFTCPPYYNLEKYTDDTDDLSNLPSYADFLYKYTIILQNTTQLLKDESFFVIVVSEVRADSHSIADSQYLGLVPDTIHILRDKCGLKYYNEIILENSIGSLPIRAPKNFSRTRKIGRHHQNILVFYKGNIENITEKFGETF